jgi:hypothetical protein
LKVGASEDVAERERFGKSFVAERAVLEVAQPSGVVTLIAHEPAIWEDGFSLIGSKPGDDLYQAIRWAVTRGVRLFDDATQDVDAQRLRNEVGDTHHWATENHPSHRTATPEQDRAAHKAHLDAEALVRRAEDRDVELVVNRLRREAVPQAAANVGRLCEKTAELRLLRGYFDAGELGRVRAFYRKTQLHNAEVKPVLNALPDDDVKAVVEDVCRAAI